MAGKRVIWSEQAEAARGRVPDEVCHEIDRRLDYVLSMPRMYAASRDERFPGCRSFWVDPAFRVHYMVPAMGRDIYVAAIVEEPVQQVEEPA